MAAPVTARPSRASGDDFPPGFADCDVRVFRLEAPRRLGYSPELKKALLVEAEKIDTTLLIHPFVLTDFLDYNDFLDQADAVYSAARYLCASGGGNSSTLYSAIFAYNHADWYVREVLGLAAQYR